MRHLGAALVMAFIAACASSASAAAQVGVSPERSPYRDLDYKMELTFLTGVYSGGNDAVGVGPQGGPYFGAIYDFGLGAFASLTGRVGVVSSKRTVIDPTRPAATRVTGEQSHLLVMSDVGFTINLTGNRTYHRLAPVVTLGMGSITALESRDLGGYSLGSRLMLSAGAGVKYSISPEWLLRLNVSDHTFSVPYPAKYQEPATDGSRVREGPGSSRIHNFVFGIGLSRRFQH